MYIMTQNTDREDSTVKQKLLWEIITTFAATIILRTLRFVLVFVLAL